MELYAQTLSYAMPFFLVLIIVEWYVGNKKGIVTNRVFDTVSSLSSGMTNSIKEVLGLAITIISYDWLVGHIAVFDIQNTLIVYILAFIGLDFAGYWTHRWEHEINILWNRHVIHHSSEEYNLACALRQNVSAIVAIFFFLYIPIAALGVPTEVIAIVAPLHLFAQFWYHTRVIDKLGWLEHFMVTPSHHRVHHAINPQYIDTNFSQIFIFWDKWFGTFQPELKEVPPVYGIKKSANTWNPIWINYQHIWQIFQDAWHANSWWDKVRVWWMPTGWRPTDVSIAYPIEINENPYTQIKYDTQPSKYFESYALFQLISNLVLMAWMFQRIGNMSLQEQLMGGGFLVLSVMAYTSVMDRSKYGMILESIKLLIGIVIVYKGIVWFTPDPGYVTLIIVLLYLIISFVSSLHFERERAFFSVDSV